MELDLEVSDNDQFDADVGSASFDVGIATDVADDAEVAEVGTEVGAVSNIGSVASLATVYWVFRRC